MTDRWQVRECPTHGIVAVSYDNCPMCWTPTLSEAFEVVRAVGARTADPDTSKLAALRQAPRSESQRGRILAALRDYGEMTSRQIEEHTGINGAWKRVSELKQGGHIREVRTTHDTETNTDVTVYGIAPVQPRLMDVDTTETEQLTLLSHTGGLR